MTGTTPAQWAELVTTALLGTDRRPLPVDDAPAAVLRQAARHRVVDRLAPLRQQDRPVPQPAPVQDAEEAPASANRLLAELLRTPDPTLVTCWMQACVEHRRLVASIHWTTLARLAARTTAYDRAALGGALGPRGRWFLQQNPEWRRLAADAQPSAEVADGPEGPDERERSGLPQLLAEDVLADPERLLAHPQPWGPELVSAAYAVLGGEGQVPPTRTFATRLGVALPTALYPTIARAGEYYVLAPDATPARRRTIRDRFVALELAAYARAAIDHAFDTTGTNDFTRAEIPHV